MPPTQLIWARKGGEEPEAEPTCLSILDNTHILHFLDERIFPFKDHKEQLGTFLGGRPLVNVVDHTCLGAEEKNCHLAGATGKGGVARRSQVMALLTPSWEDRAPHRIRTTP